MLVTLDVIMPGMDGWAVLGELKADPAISRIPAVLVTMRDDKQMGLGLDASDYLTKPLDRDQLRQALERHRNAPPPAVSTDCR
ncbi:MAG: response regulator [Polyangiaceae bacterium]|nr:response regulator [Polyangiaceae bacterium]